MADIPRARNYNSILACFCFSAHFLDHESSSIHDVRCDDEFLPRFRPMRSRTNEVMAVASSEVSLK